MSDSDTPQDSTPQEDAEAVADFMANLLNGQMAVTMAINGAIDAVASNLPATRERSLVITKLEEAMMWADRAGRIG